MSHHKRVSYSDVSAAAYKLMGSIFTLGDVDAFLSHMDVNKDNSTRFVCWLIAFGLLAPDHEKWADQLYRLYEKYEDNVIPLLHDPANPLQSVTSSSATIIQCDLMRGIHWFEMFAKELKLSDFYTKDAELMATRVLSALSLSVPGFSYCQGYDRYMFMTQLLALDFCAQSGLDPQFAEAISFFLADQFIKMTHISRYLENPVLTEEHFEKMDQVMMTVVPDTMRLLSVAQQGSIHFALRWELLLFADEYDARPLMLLWDQVLRNKEKYEQFLFGLCIAHIKQVPVAAPHEIMVEKIQQFKSWNIQEIVQDASYYMSFEKQSIWNMDNLTTKYILFLLALLLLLWILIRIGKSTFY